MTNLDHQTPGSEPQRSVPEHPDRNAPEPVGSSPVRLAMLVAATVLLGLWAGVSALIVVLAIVVMIFLHELGHFITARAAGMKCTEFFIGFGPRIWSFKRGETEYGIKAIPAGAYVRVIGMTTLEEVDPADEPRTYRQKPYWRRMSVAVAGSGMHFLIALVCLFTFFAGFGVPQDEVWEVGRLASIGESDSLGPAGDAGLEVGDEIVSIGGAPIEVWEDLRDAIAAQSPGEEVTVSVLRDGRPVDIEVALGENESGGAFLGVGPYYPPQRQAVTTAASTTISEFGSYSKLTVESIVRIFSPSGLANFFGSAVDTARPSDTPASAVPVEDQGDRVLSIYGAARLGTQMAESGAAGLLGFLALINIFIGIFNLVPLLPLDGGHVAIATYEKVRELLSRSSARYHADVSKLMPLTYVVIFVLVGVGVVALYLDIASPFDLPN